MKIPAIKGKIGIWDYYVTTLTFEQVAKFVSKVDEELHKSTSLRDLIQRSITDNYLSIKDYIISQKELFFNSLVLAVYDDYPNWIEIKFEYDNNESFKMGLLDFPGNHKVFPVDGQHRVEGIKEAIKNNPELRKQEISAIFIGHKNSESGRIKTRRLFTTLNRYAKPVKLSDIIALDEDDLIAICTRELLETHILFQGKRINITQQKAIPDKDKDAFTSIITLYECNIELYKNYYRIKNGKKLNPSILKEKQKFRVNEEELKGYISYVKDFWSVLLTKYEPIKLYNKINTNPALKYRNNENGGNIIFRPIGLLPFVQALIEINLKENKTFETIVEKYNKINFQIDSVPWISVAWNPITKTMIMSNKLTIKLLMKYLLDKKLLNKAELLKLKNSYAIATNQIDNVENSLIKIK